MIQKRLILINLKEAYVISKNTPKTPVIELSSFYSFRPKFCIPGADGLGTHTVCVCSGVSAFFLCNSNKKTLMAKYTCKGFYYATRITKCQ